jgi:hypothetical protein
MRIAFDVDDTLIIPSVAQVGEYYERTSPVDTPNFENIAILRWFQSQGHDIIIWSGGGVDYAQMWGDKLGLMPFEVRMKQADADIDIAFDDCDVKLGTVNVKVKRLNNHISRAHWNKYKHGEA